MNDGPERMRNTELSSHEVEAAPDTSPEALAFEAELTRALRPVELPAGFADRVVARAAPAKAQEQPRRAKVLPFRSWRVGTVGAIAASLLVGLFVATDIHEQHERAERCARATQQFQTATRITDQALEQTREQLERAGVFGQ